MSCVRTMRVMWHNYFIFIYNFKVIMLHDTIKKKLQIK
jgi:hypothetical protein